MHRDKEAMAVAVADSLDKWKELSLDENPD